MKTNEEKFEQVQHLEFQHYHINYIYSDDKYTISIAPNFGYLFAYSDTKGTTPGWMSALRFDNATDAIIYGESIKPIIKEAQIAHGYWTSAQKNLIDNLYHEFGRQSGYPQHSR